MKSTNSEIIESLKNQNTDQYKRIQSLEITIATALAKIGLENCGSPTGNGLMGDVKDIENNIKDILKTIENNNKKSFWYTVYGVIICLVLGALAPSFVMEVVERFAGVFAK